MKAKLALVGVLVAVLALTGVGCKATGGGWLYNEAFDENDPYGYGHRVTFGFNAHLDGNLDDFTYVVKGQFQLVDHDAKVNLHGTFDDLGVMGLFAGVCTVKGKGMLNGEGPFACELNFIDAGEPGPGAGDWVEIHVGDAYPWLYCYSGTLAGGNIQDHPDEE